jgi:hypothetical protein
MFDPITTLGVVALVVTCLSFVLARIIPDEYDRLSPRRLDIGSDERF